MKKINGKTLLIAVLLFLSLMTIMPSAAEGSTVGAGSVPYSSLRKTFYTLDRWWVFYISGGNVVWETSTDGTTWSGSVGTALDKTNTIIQVDVTARGGEDWVGLVAWESTSQVIHFRKGTLASDGSISWSDAVAILDVGSSDGYTCNVERDVNDVWWAAIPAYYSTNYYYMIYSSPDGVTWTQRLSYKDGSHERYMDTQILPWSNGSVYFLCADYNLAGITWFKWTGSMSGATYHALTAGMSTNTLKEDKMSACVDYNNLMHIVWVSSTGHVFYKTFNGITWSSETELDNNAGNNFVTIGCSLLNYLDVFYIRSKDIFHNYYTTSWQGRDNPFGTTFTTPTQVSCEKYIITYCSVVWEDSGNVIVNSILRGWKAYEYAVSQFLNLYSSLSSQVSLSFSKVDFLGLLSSASRQTSVSSAKSDMLNLFGFPTRQISVFSSPLDHLGLYTSIEKLAGFSRSQADTLSLFAEITRQISVSYNPADLLGLYSAAVRGVGVSLSRGEILNLFDSATKQISVSKSALDKLNLYSGLERLAGFYRTQNQLLGLYSSVSREIDVVKAMTDALSLSSSLLKQISISKSVSDVLALVGSIARQIAVQRPLGDFLQLLSDAQKGGNIQQYIFSLVDLLRLFGKTTSETTSPTVPSGWLPLVKFTVGTLNLNVAQNQTVNALLNFTWQGARLIMVTNVSFEGPSAANWLSLAETLPKTVSNETGVGENAVKIRVTVPNDAQPGEYVVPVTIDAEAMMLTAAVPKMMEVTVTGNGWVFVVVKQPPEGPPVLSFVFVLFIAVAIGLVLIAIGLTQARHAPKTKRFKG